MCPQKNTLISSSMVSPPNQALMGGFIRLNTLKNYGTWFLIYCYSLNYQMANCCFLFLLETSLKSNIMKNSSIKKKKCSRLIELRCTFIEHKITIQIIFSEIQVGPQCLPKHSQSCPCVSSTSTSQASNLRRSIPSELRRVAILSGIEFYCAT